MANNGSNVGNSPTAVHSGKSPDRPESEPAPYRAYKRRWDKGQDQDLQYLWGRPLRIGGAHIARRTAAAEIDPRSEEISDKIVHDGRRGLNGGKRSGQDDVPALSDLAVSLFFLNVNRGQNFT